MKIWLLLLVVIGWANLLLAANEEGEGEAEVVPEQVQDTHPEPGTESSTAKPEPTEKMGSESSPAAPAEPEPEVKPENGGVINQITLFAMVSSLAASLSLYL